MLDKKKQNEQQKTNKNKSAEQSKKTQTTQDKSVATQTQSPPTDTTSTSTQTTPPTNTTTTSTQSPDPNAANASTQTTAPPSSTDNNTQTTSAPLNVDLKSALNKFPPLYQALAEAAQGFINQGNTGADLEFSYSKPIEIQAQDIGEWNRNVAIPSAQEAMRRQSQIEDFVNRYNKKIDLWNQMMRGENTFSSAVQQSVGSPFGIGEYGGYILTGGKLAPPQFQAPPDLFKRVEVKDQQEKFGFKIDNKPKTGGGGGGFGGQRTKPYLNITIGNKDAKDTYTVGKDVLISTAFEKVASNAFNTNDYLAGMSPNWEILFGTRDTNVNNLGNIGDMIKKHGDVIQMNFDINQNNNKYTKTISINTKSNPINTVSDLYGSIYDAFNKNDELSDQTYELRKWAGRILNESVDDLKKVPFKKLMEQSMNKIFLLSDTARGNSLNALYTGLQNFANKLVYNGSAMKFFQRAFNKADRHLRLLWGKYDVQGSYVTLDALVKDGIVSALTSMTWADILPKE